MANKRKPIVPLPNTEKNLLKPWTAFILNRADEEVTQVNFLVMVQRGNLRVDKKQNFSIHWQKQGFCKGQAAWKFLSENTLAANEDKELAINNGWKQSTHLSYRNTGSEITPNWLGIETPNLETYVKTGTESTIMRSPDTGNHKTGRQGCHAHPGYTWGPCSR